MTDTTLAQRLRSTMPQYLRGLLSSDDVESDLNEAADTITSLQEQVKALRELTKQFDRYVMSGEMDSFDRATAAEAKLAKVQAELDETEQLRADWCSKAVAALNDRDRLSTELAEARKVGLAVLASWDERMGGEVEVLKTMAGSNRQYWSPGASMVHSSVIADLRHFLAGNKETNHD